MDAVWKYAHASVAGTKHLNLKRDCEDYNCAFWHQASETLILIAADGAGFADQAIVGAKKASEFVEVFVAEQLEKTPAVVGDKEAFQHFLVEIAEKTRLALIELAFQAQTHQEEFSTTLLLSICSPTYWGMLQIGDGFIITMDNEGNLDAAFLPSKGQYANETIFLTSFESFEVLRHEGFVQTRVLEANNLGALALLTDGLEYAAMSMRGQPKPQKTFFHKLFHNLSLTDSQIFTKNLEHYLRHSEKLKEVTDDDKTLVLALNTQKLAKLSLKEP